MSTDTQPSPNSGATSCDFCPDIQEKRVKALREESRAGSYKWILQGFGLGAIIWGTSTSLVTQTAKDDALPVVAIFAGAALAVWGQKLAGNATIARLELDKWALEHERNNFGMEAEDAGLLLTRHPANPTSPQP